MQEKGVLVVSVAKLKAQRCGVEDAAKENAKEMAKQMIKPKRKATAAGLVLIEGGCQAAGPKPKTPGSNMKTQKEYVDASIGLPPQMVNVVKPPIEVLNSDLSPRSEAVIRVVVRRSQSDMQERKSRN